MLRRLTKPFDYRTPSSPISASELINQGYVSPWEGGVGIGPDPANILPLPTPDYGQLAQQLQGHLQAGALNAYRGYHGLLASYHPATIKVDRAVKALCAQIPMRVAQRILSIELLEETKDRPLRILIRYNNRTETEFYDVDAFPNDVHIARIMMECP